MFGMNKKTEKKAEEKTETAPQPQGQTEEKDSLKSATEIALERAATKTAAQESTAEANAMTLSPTELDALKEQAAKATEHWDRLLRTQAEHDNYRKRMTRERQELIKIANEKLLGEILTPLDHFEMGLQATQQSSPVDPFRQGMEMVFQQFQQFLKSQGVSEIEALGQNFNPLLHEAVAYQESASPEGQVIHQIRKGYRLQDKLLRASTVIVSKGKPAEQPPAEPPKEPVADKSQEDGASPKKEEKAEG